MHKPPLIDRNRGLNCLKNQFPSYELTRITIDDSAAGMGARRLILVLRNWHDSLLIKPHLKQFYSRPSMFREKSKGRKDAKKVSLSFRPTGEIDLGPSHSLGMKNLGPPPWRLCDFAGVIIGVRGLRNGQNGQE
jgi:hypothetical protein